MLSLVRPGGTVCFVVARTYAGLDKVAEAQHDLECGHEPGKRVIVLAAN